MVAEVEYYCIIEVDQNEIHQIDLFTEEIQAEIQQSSTNATSINPSDQLDAMKTLYAEDEFLYAYCSKIRFLVLGFFVTILCSILVAMGIFFAYTQSK